MPRYGQEEAQTQNDKRVDMTQQLFKRYENVFNAKLITLRNRKGNTHTHTNAGSQACPLM